MDETAPVPKPVSKPKEYEKQLSQDYMSIGESLLECEARFLTAGIPWVYPTLRVVQARNRVSEPESVHFRQCVVGMKTGVLKSYLEDLQDVDCPLNDEEGGKELFFELVHPLERWGFTFLLSAACMALSLLVLSLVSIPFQLSAFAGLLTGAMGAAVGVSFSSESFRRRSFSRIIRREICRRRGDDGDGTRIGILSMGDGVGA